MPIDFVVKKRQPDNQRLTSKSDRLLGVPEVWLWRKSALEIWTLRPDKSGYDGPARKSRLLRGLDVDLLERCLALPSWRGARSAFRRGLRQRRK